MRRPGSPEMGVRVATVLSVRDESVEAGIVLRCAVASLLAGASVIHLSTAGEHGALFASAFVAMGVFQGLCAAGFVAWPGASLSLVAAAGSAAIIGTWLVSHTVGLPFGPGAGIAETMGLKDLTATAFEAVAIVGAVLLTIPSLADRRLRIPVASAALPIVSAVVLAATLPAVVVRHAHGPHANGDSVAIEAGHGRADMHPAGASHVPEAHIDDAAHAPAAVHTPAAVHETAVHETAVHETAPHVAAESHEAVAATHEPDSGENHHAAPPASQPRPVREAPPPPAVGGETPPLTTRVRYGPIALAPASLGGRTHASVVVPDVAKPCSDCYLTGLVPDLEYEDGSTANFHTGPMLHHAVWTYPETTDVTCQRREGIGMAGQRFFGSGNERTPLVLPDGFGYYVGTGNWSLIYEIMNHSEEPQAVYITLDATYRLGSEDLKKVTPVWLDIENCRTSEYAVPAGPSHESWFWTSTLTGRIVSTGGHVHDGGIKTVLRNESTDTEICTSWAGYGTKTEYEGTIESMSGCVWDAVGTVRGGEVLGIHSYYDSAFPVDDAMGIMLAYVYQTGDLTAGTSPPPEEDGGTGAPPSSPHH